MTNLVYEGQCMDRDSFADIDLREFYIEQTTIQERQSIIDVVNCFVGSETDIAARMICEQGIQEGSIYGFHGQYIAKQFLNGLFTHLEDPTGHLVTATDSNGNLIGFSCLITYDHEVVELNTVVAQERRGQGIGSKMVDLHHQYLRGLGIGSYQVTLAGGESIYRKLNANIIPTSTPANYIVHLDC